MTLQWNPTPISVSMRIMPTSWQLPPRLLPTRLTTSKQARRRWISVRSPNFGLSNNHRGLCRKLWERLLQLQLVWWCLCSTDGKSRRRWEFVLTVIGTPYCPRLRQICWPYLPNVQETPRLWYNVGLIIMPVVQVPICLGGMQKAVCKEL